MTTNQFKTLQYIQQGYNDFELLSSRVDLSEFDELVTDGFVKIDKTQTCGIMQPTPVYQLTGMGELALTPSKP